MSKENGFVPIRRGVWEHVRDGRMSLTEAAAFIYICSQADTRTGIWKGSAKSLSGELGMPERTARDVLEKMEHGDYIRRFAVPGRHSCYPILVHKFPITQGEHNGEQLNAMDSKSPGELSYFPREHGVEQHGEHGAAQRRIENREKRKKQNPDAKTASEAAANPAAGLSVSSFLAEKQRRREAKARRLEHEYREQTVDLAPETLDVFFTRHPELIDKYPILAERWRSHLNSKTTTGQANGAVPTMPTRAPVNSDLLAVAGAQR